MVYKIEIYAYLPKIKIYFFSFRIKVGSGSEKKVWDPLPGLKWTFIVYANIEDQIRIVVPLHVSVSTFSQIGLIGKNPNSSKTKVCQNI